MWELVGVGIVAGVIAGISPCILPVLPVVLVSGATAPAPGSAPPGQPAAGATRGATRPRGGGRGRPVAVVGGLVVSFTFIVLAGSTTLAALGLPQDLLRQAGVGLLVLVGAGYLLAPLGQLLERPFARLRLRQPSGTASGFVVGLALGALFVPCAGPVLAALTVVGATGRVGLRAAALAAAFALGVSIPLLAAAVAGQALADRVRALRRHAPRLRQVGGAVLVAMAAVIELGTLSSLQRDVPGYVTALQGRVEGSAGVRHQLAALTSPGGTTGATGGRGAAAAGTLAACDPAATTLLRCGPAPALRGITAWLNTPGGRPLTLAGLRGRVVLVDFWTYSCINCQRALPHVEAWARGYAGAGLEVIGVHTPEFPFEHVLANVTSQAAALGVRYPVAVDDRYATWDAYHNEYWPAEYLIDATGTVRHVHFGEGGYATTEHLIRQLLAAAHPGLALPGTTDVADHTPTTQLTPETYVGYARAQDVANPRLERDRTVTYQRPLALPFGELAFSGTWTVHADEATAGPGAAMALGFTARDVYLVAGGTGTLRVSVDQGPPRALSVSGVPRLYTLVAGRSISTATLSLTATPGLQLYDFTFG